MLVTSLIFVTVLLLLAILRKVYEWNKFKNILSRLPGPKTYHRILGDIPILVGRTKEGLDFHVLLLQSLSGLATVFRKEGLYRVWLSYKPFVYLYSPDLIEPMIKNNSLLDKAEAYDMLYPWLKTGLLTSKRNKWKKRRKLLTPTFHYRILEDFILIFDKNSKTFIQTLRDLLDKGCIINIIPLATFCALDIISETIMGVELNTQKENDFEYVKAICHFTEMFMVRVTKPWLANDVVFFKTSEGKKLKRTVRVLHEFTENVLKQRKEELKKQTMLKTQDNSENCERKEKKALLDLLLQLQLEGNPISDQDICEEVDTFMFAGHDTTAMALSWTLYHLGLHPDIQQKVYEELDEIFGNDKERPIRAEDLRRMKYLECVLKESQRLSPPVPMISRYCSEEIKLKNYVVPRGCSITILIYALHRNPDIFPDPDIFDPDRFLPENCVGRHPFAFIPFSAGIRNCIGQKYAMTELKVVVSNVIRNFILESVEPPDNIRETALLVLRPKDDRLLIRFKRRL